MIIIKTTTITFDRSNKKSKCNFSTQKILAINKKTNKSSAENKNFE